MFEKLKVIRLRYEELNQLLSSPEVIGNRDKFRKIAKEHAELEPFVQCLNEWEKVTKEKADAAELLELTDDSQMRELAKVELDELKQQEAELEAKLLLYFVPKDPRDDKNIILEIRAGTGGDESALFGEDLFSMYSRFAEKQGWKVEVLSSSSSSVGGYKELISRIEGKGAYSAFKYEQGVHRVQRVPDTETQGRVHTSTVTVAVLPEAEEIDIQIDDKDLRIDVFRASGPGGQSVNTTDSAVRVTHLPTNMVAICQDEKSQLKNKLKALSVLRSRLLDMKQAEQDAERSEERRGQIGSGERAEKIRTYNFPQSRVTDHRIGLTLYQLDSFIGGEMNLLIEPLRAHFQTEALKGDNSAAKV